MIATMTTDGLRAAGQVEIAGLEAVPNWRRAGVLKDHLLNMFPALPHDTLSERIHIWMGHRPSMPDGLPCIGRASATRDVVYAFDMATLGLAAPHARDGLLHSFSRPRSGNPSFPI